MKRRAFPVLGPLFVAGISSYVGVSKNRYPKMDGLEWKTLLKWMIWGENPLFSETSMLLHCCKSGKTCPTSPDPQEFAVKPFFGVGFLFPENYK